MLQTLNQSENRNIIERKKRQEKKEKEKEKRSHKKTSLLSWGERGVSKAFIREKKTNDENAVHLRNKHRSHNMLSSCNNTITKLQKGGGGQKKGRGGGGGRKGGGVGGGKRARGVGSKQNHTYVLQSYTCFKTTNKELLLPQKIGPYN